ncbi:hypothetical protein WR25_23410 [Diploscapter pachys]|uniref:Uncharacterized protein n=1 Tax=Diploscapter pachys TaxID=2018661 RepID=A0A2A2JM98_9BILA|nr:hypothetical protein WR25_23410 [Diploscapter pachys]
MEMGNDGGIGAPEYRLQFSRGNFRIGLDSALQFVVFDRGWSFIALIFLEARISCCEAIESAVDCPTGSSALTKCIVDVSGRSARVIVLAPPLRKIDRTNAEKLPPGSRAASTLPFVRRSHGVHPAPPSAERMPCEWQCASRPASERLPGGSFSAFVRSILC